MVLKPYDLSSSLVFYGAGNSGLGIRFCSYHVFLGPVFPHALHAAAGLGTRQASKCPTVTQGWGLPCGSWVTDSWSHGVCAHPGLRFPLCRTGAGAHDSPKPLRAQASEIMGPCQSGVRHPREKRVLGFGMNILSVSSAVTNTSLSWI